MVLICQQTREEGEQRRQEKQRQIEQHAEAEEEDPDMPAWKREIMMKKGAPPKNWGDEREDVNAEDD